MGVNKSIAQQQKQFDLFLKHFSYIRETGEFAYKDDGCERDVSHDGFIRLRHKMGGDFDKTVYAHKLAFYAVTKTIPQVVRHIDGNRTNNRFDNLEGGQKSKYGVRPDAEDAPSGLVGHRATASRPKHIRYSSDRETNTRIRVRVSTILDSVADLSRVDRKIRELCDRHALKLTGEVDYLPIEEIDKALGEIVPISDKIAFLRRLAIKKKGNGGEVIGRVRILDTRLPYFIRRGCYTAGIPDDLVFKLTRLCIISRLSPSTAMNRIFFPEGMRVTAELISTVSESCRPVSMSEWTDLYMSDIN